MKKVLFYDCFAGISGDMNLGALVDLGVDPDYLKQELEKLGVEGFRLEISRDKRKGISGTKVTVVMDNPENEKHRHLHHIEDIVNGSSLSDEIKQKSLEIFKHIAVAEAKIHDIPIQKVHFHEVGALDSIADIVGAAIAIDALNVDMVISSSVQLGGGFVNCAHGKMPVPAPATAEIVKKMPVKTGLVNYEATTPTGAAIIAAYASVFSDTNNFKILKTGYGIGQRDGEVPNVLRVYLCEDNNSSSDDYIQEAALMLECNIDDMSPEDYPELIDNLLEAGALDVFITPILMKKSRPAHKLSVLCDRKLAPELKRIIFTNSTSIGVREYAVTKNNLQREKVIVDTKYGKVGIKVCYLNGEVLSIKPEYEDCQRLSDQHKVSVNDVRNLARWTYEQRK